MHANAYANQYRQTSTTSAVLDASPHQLVLLMLSGARERVRLAGACIDRGDVVRKAKAISEASAIIAGLSGTLDMKAGGDIAAGLQSLYDYFQRKLVEANAGNNAAALAEVDDLLGDIEGAWKAIDPDAPASAPAPMAQ